MTPIKVVVGGPTISNEPPAEPEEEQDGLEAKTAAAKGSMKAAPEATRDWYVYLNKWTDKLNDNNFYEI